MVTERFTTSDDSDIVQCIEEAETKRTCHVAGCDSTEIVAYGLCDEHWRSLSLKEVRAVASFRGQQQRAERNEWIATAAVVICLILLMCITIFSPTHR